MAKKFVFHNLDDCILAIICMLLIFILSILLQYHKLQGSLNKFPDFFRMGTLLIVHI